ncbi:hypothetical protein [Micromonospora sp. S4605]|uniref:hypothetical protein n=1 Tax=Micromonospora sp. S4605 TaxID=1420897 RepID=UPI0011B5B615|nr:hypothetical protein [Micromonospora sp. S4605]
MGDYRPPPNKTEELRKLYSEIEVAQGRLRESANRKMDARRLRRLEKQAEALKKTDLVLKLGPTRLHLRWSAQQVAKTFISLHLAAIAGGVALMTTTSLRELGFALTVGGFLGNGALLASIWQQVYKNEREAAAAAGASSDPGTADPGASYDQVASDELRELLEQQREATAEALTRRALLRDLRYGVAKEKIGTYGFGASMLALLSSPVWLPGGLGAVESLANSKGEPLRARTASAATAFAVNAAASTAFLSVAAGATLGASVVVRRIHKKFRST